MTYRFWYVGSMDWLTPVMLAMVAVGAMAMVLELRMPTVLTCSRSVSQSNRPDCDSSCVRYWPRLSRSRRMLSMGRMPWLHSEPSKLGYLPRSAARPLLALMAK